MMRTKKKPVRRKALPLWAIIAAIAGVVIVLIVIFMMLPGEEGNLERTDPEAAQMEKDFFEKTKDVNYFRRLKPDLQKAAVDKKVVPPEWGEGNYVPFYDPQTGRK